MVDHFEGRTKIAHFWEQSIPENRQTQQELSNCGIYDITNRNFMIYVYTPPGIFRVVKLKKLQWIGRHSEGGGKGAFGTLGAGHLERPR
jgi:hypothetical protein